MTIVSMSDFRSEERWFETRLVSLLRVASQARNFVPHCLSSCPVGGGNTPSRYVLQQPSQALAVWAAQTGRATLSFYPFLAIEWFFIQVTVKRNQTVIAEIKSKQVHTIESVFLTVLIVSLLYRGLCKVSSIQ